jgi:hypothetical protein
MSCRGVLVILLGFVLQVSAADKKPGREEGEFRIRVGGEEIGGEKFIIVNAGESVSSTSVLDFRSPGDKQRVQMESRLEMTARFVPTNYQLKSEVDGKKGMITGEFSPNQAIFQYTGPSGQPRKAGVLVGKEFTILDTNLFHHFVFLARLFDFDSKEQIQRFEVVIPQETDSGVLSIRQSGREQIQVHGKKIDARRLQVDSGALVMQMWVDNQHVLYRIAVPSKELEVVRN